MVSDRRRYSNMTDNPGNGGPPAGAEPPANTPSEPDMLDKLLEAARTNPQLRAKFNAVVETFSGGSKAPDDNPDENPEDTPGGHMEEGEMDERPRYIGGDEDYILELEAQQLQIQAENEALRQALSTITSQVKSPPLPPRRPDLAGRAAAPASTRQPVAGAAGPGRAAPTGPSPLALPLPLSLGSRSIPGPDKWTDACSSTHRRALAFCDDLERHCERCRLDVASTLPAFLTGAARNTWYPSIKESYAALYADVPDWPYLRTAFCEYTGDDLRDDCNVARTKLLDGAIKMTAGMLLGQYITEFRNNLLFAGNDSMCQPLLAMVFTRGLSSALQPAVLKDLAHFKDPTLSQAMEAAKQAQRNVVMLSTTTPAKGAGSSGVHAVQASSALGGEAHPGRRGSKPPVSGGAGKRPRHDELWSKKPLLPGQYCFKCNHPGHLTNHPCPFRHFTAIEARRRSGYAHPPEGAKKPGQAKSKPPSESGASESDQEPEPQPPPKASRPKDQGMRRGVSRARIATNRPTVSPPPFPPLPPLPFPLPPSPYPTLSHHLQVYHPTYLPPFPPPPHDTLQPSPYPTLGVAALSLPYPWQTYAIPPGFLLSGPEVVYTPLSAKTAAKWLKDGGTGVVALVSYENLQDPPGVPPEQAAQLKSLLMEFSDVFEPITGQQKRRLQEGEDVGAGTPLSSGSGGSEQQPAAGSDPDHDADSDDALKPSEPKRLRQVRFKKRMEYLVKWTGYDDTYNTWEPEAMLAGAPQILSRYKAVHNLP
ncbi:hypothetical protein QJQ45_027226 [Haematococcus lacustris]|nr:hypothetical protein QJQ45_027226 [Haematococcus lacustris]